MAIFNDSNPRQIGIVGLGIIGSRVAEVLRKAGVHVYVWNRTPRPAPNFLSSPGEMAHLAEVIQIFVTDGKALLGVVKDLEGKLTRRHVIVSNSTVDPASAREAAAMVREMGGSFLDAPFTGSKQAAEKAALVYYVGGDPSVLDRVRSLLELSAREILFVGEVGAASILKIATNMISATTVQALAEAYALTVRCGIDPRKLAEALEQNACHSALTSMKIPTMIAGDYEPHFSLKNMFKDAKLGLNLANELKLDLPALSTAASVMFKTIQKGHGEKDYSVLAKTYQDDPAGKTARDGERRT